MIRYEKPVVSSLLFGDLTTKLQNSGGTLLIPLCDPSTDCLDAALGYWCNPQAQELTVSYFVPQAECLPVPEVCSILIDGQSFECSDFSDCVPNEVCNGQTGAVFTCRGNHSCNVNTVIVGCDDEAQVSCGERT